MKTGDTIRLTSTGEELVLAFEDAGHVAWLGWPPGMVRCSYVEVVEECSSQESEKLIQELAKSTSNDFRHEWARRHLALRELAGGDG